MTEDLRDKNRKKTDCRVHSNANRRWKYYSQNSRNWNKSCGADGCRKEGVVVV